MMGKSVAKSNSNRRKGKPAFSDGRKMANKKTIQREKIKDSKFGTGPVKKLIWTGWNLAISPQNPPELTGAKFKLSERYNLFLRKNLFENDFFIPAIYEIGVMLPGIKRRRIYPLYFKATLGITAYKGVEAISLIANPKVRQEANRVLGDNCQIYIRRGVMKEWTDKHEQIETLTKHLRKIDYAWRKHGKGGHRKLVRNKIVLSDDKL